MMRNNRIFMLGVFVMALSMTLFTKTVFANRADTISDTFHVRSAGYEPTYTVTHFSVEEEAYHSTDCDPANDHFASSYIEVNRSYPQFVGLEPNIQTKVNTTIKKAAGLFDVKAEWESSIDVSYKITYRYDDVIGILFIENDFPCGAYHEKKYYRSLNIDLKTGNYIKFKDIFILASENEKNIESLIRNKLNTYFADPPCNSSTDGLSLFERERCHYAFSDVKHFYFDLHNLYITFDMYEIASAAADAPIISIPLKDLEPFLDPDGILGWFLRWSE